jgi:adenosine deaminase
MAILISSLGNVPDIMLEVLAFTNMDSIPFYKNHSKFDEIYKAYEEHFKEDPVTTVWIYSPQQDNKIEEYCTKLETWNKSLKVPFNFSFIILPFQDITSQLDVEYSREVAFRLVKKAHEESKEGGQRIYISIAAGRKTIVSDLQDAGTFFGCDAFIHVLDTGKKGALGKLNRSDSFLERDISNIPQDEIDKFLPIWYGKSRPNPLYHMIKEDFKIPVESERNYLTRDQFDKPETLVSTYRKFSEKAGNIFSHREDRTLLYNFPLLQQLDETTITQLKNKKVQIANDVRLLPKIDLHCHLGGCLDVKDIVSIALKALEEYPGEIPATIEDARNVVSEWKQDCKSIKNTSYRKRLKTIAAFYGHEDELEKLWFEQFLEERNFAAIDFEAYERLGDLQGSGLLQNKTAIMETVRELLQKALEDGCIGLEIRCSPQNYTQEGLQYKDVLETIIKGVHQYKDSLKVGIILIASRHRTMNEIYKSIEMYEEIANNSDDEFKKIFTTYVKGFDVAGDESVRSPHEMRNAFIPHLQQCLPITIHAGENQEADKIWEAVYELNSDRIGHGLSLINNEALLKKFVDRNIGIELCPSSNFQIIGYHDYELNAGGEKEYPLQEYLERGLKVTLNTDNRGISRTSLCNEFVKASHMTQGGISLLEALQLCKNSIDISFFSYEEKQSLYETAEKQLIKWLEGL